MFTGFAGGAGKSGSVAASKLFFGPFPVGNGVSQARVSCALAVTCNHQVRRCSADHNQLAGSSLNRRASAFKRFPRSIVRASRKVSCMHDEKTVPRFISTLNGRAVLPRRPIHLSDRVLPEQHEPVKKR